MGSPIVEAGEVAPEPRAHTRHGFVGVQIDLLVLDGAPEPLDEHVVAPLRHELLPLRDLVRVDIKSGGELRQGGVVRQGRESNLGLASRGMVSMVSSHEIARRKHGYIFAAKSGRVQLSACLESSGHVISGDSLRLNPDAGCEWNT